MGSSNKNKNKNAHINMKPTTKAPVKPAQKPPVKPVAVAAKAPVKGNIKPQQPALKSQPVVTKPVFKAQPPVVNKKTVQAPPNKSGQPVKNVAIPSKPAPKPVVNAAKNSHQPPALNKKPQPQPQPQRPLPQKSNPAANRPAAVIVKNIAQPKKEDVKKIAPQAKEVVTKAIQQARNNEAARKGVMNSSKDNKPQSPRPEPAVKAMHVQPPSTVHDADFNRETLAVLFKAAKKASEHAYAPYSHFKVGVVLLLDDNKGDGNQFSAYTGCNVENASYSMTCCAERIAMFKAISDGNKKFKAMVLYSSSKKPVSPCGACRQVLMEFAPGNMKIYSIGQFKDEDVNKTQYAVYTVKDLLPSGFTASDFMEKK